MDADTHRVTLADEPVRLTPREFTVLMPPAEHAGRVITQTQLLRKIWGPVHEHDTHYLRIVISRLRQKLNDAPEQARLIQTEAGVGYRLATPDSLLKKRPVGRFLSQ